MRNQKGQKESVVTAEKKNSKLFIKSVRDSYWTSTCVCVCVCVCVCDHHHPDSPRWCFLKAVVFLFLATPNGVFTICSVHLGRSAVSSVHRFSLKIKRCLHYTWGAHLISVASAGRCLARSFSHFSPL